MKTAPLSVLTTVALALSLVACSAKKPASASFVKKVSLLKQVPAPGPSARPGEVSVAAVGANSLQADAGMALESEVTFNKKDILNRDFLYGSDLQYSAINDTEYELTLQSMTLGHVPVRFRVMGNLLQLVADQRANFESDVNHPERLVHEFPITHQDADTISISITKGSPLLATVIGDLKAPAPRSSWIRSVEYISEGQYLLFESSIEGADGSVMEFMESLFPRETLVPAGYKPLLADPDREPLAERYRFLTNAPVYMDLPGEGRVQTAAANRFLLKDKPIDWYVTANIPDAYLTQIRAAVEGWNRYSQAMFARDMMHFAGKVPVGVKIGDPRYNIINWDNVAMAGAAYESQASDPLTGIQSHSLIYLPLAWVNIGKEYWENGQFSDATEGAQEALNNLLAKRSFMGRKMPVNCLDNPAAQVALEARQDPESFARELLKGTLFHELGHALGLAHNFKGSLSYDPVSGNSMFSTSIMDYNHYNLERSAFESVDSEKGPLLEYDRQIISVLYNEGRDVKASDSVVPACADEESDSVANGVDPLCIRYDFGHDPTQSLADMIRLVSEPTFAIRGMQSLPKALDSLTAELAATSDESDLTAALDQVMSDMNSVLGVVNFYVASGANSLNYMTRANVRSLYIFRDGVLPAGYDAAAMRTRAMDGLSFVAKMDKLPAAAELAMNQALGQSLDWFKTTSAVKALDPVTQAKVIAKVQAKILQVAGLVQKSLLPKVRARVLGSVARVSTAPFYMEVSAGASTDYEALTLGMLEMNLISASAGATRPLEERVALAQSLMTYADVAEGKAVITRVRAALGVELAAAQTAVDREAVRTLLKKLSPESTAFVALAQ
ncbi:MAG: zinc-dependent metalloprotease [Bdellovibrionales bacterium]|nr:zinc-dependent metalloprotease [Bdellovibrionales bacterium]